MPVVPVHLELRLGRHHSFFEKLHLFLLTLIGLSDSHWGDVSSSFPS